MQQPTPVKLPQISDFRDVREGVAFLVEEQLPGQPAITVMQGVFLTDQDQVGFDSFRTVEAKFRDGLTGKIHTRRLHLGLELGFFDQAFRTVYRLPAAPF